MKKSKKGTQDILTVLPIGPHDLLALEHILSGTIAYLRRTAPCSAQTVTKIRHLEEIKTRILHLRLAGEGHHATVSRDDILMLREALQTFVQLTRRLVPPSPERDAVFTHIRQVRNHLETMLFP